MWTRRCVLAGVVLALLGAPSAWGQGLCPGDGLPTFASDGGAGDWFGVSVAIDGDTAIVGAHGDDDRGTDSGSAYVFERVDGVWTEAAKLTAADGQPGDRFGWSVAISGDTAIVGAYLDDSRRGAAYVFQRVDGVWTEAAKLTAADRQTRDYFGVSVAIAGDTAVVGAYGDDSNRGAAYVFERVGNAWTQVAKLTAADGPGGSFGLSVAISGDMAVVGAMADDDRGTGAGAAYVFERVGNAWTQVAKLTASDGQGWDRFGVSVAISGDTAVVGAYRDDNDRGSAYVFERAGNAWTQVAKLTASDGQAEDHFGVSVAIAGDTAVVGAYHDDDLGPAAGSAYVFERAGNAWTQAHKLTAADGQTNDYFGISVAISGDTAVVGAYGDDNRGYNAGSVYFMRAAADPCCADSDGSGVLDADDFFVFLDLFAAGDPRADFTGDGVIDAGDFFAYLEAFAAGCP